MLSLFIHHRQIATLVDEQKNDYLALVKLLLGGVEDINTVALPTLTSSAHSYDGGGTVLDLYSHYLADYGPASVDERSILNLLLSRGAELSKPIGILERMHLSYSTKYIVREMFVLRQIPEAAERKILFWFS